METTSLDPFHVHRAGPRQFYVRDTVTGELHGPTFSTRKATQDAVDARNEVRRDHPVRRSSCGCLARAEGTTIYRRPCAEHASALGS
jgi:hypothetical protein